MLLQQFHYCQFDSTKHYILLMTCWYQQLVNCLFYIPGIPKPTNKIIYDAFRRFCYRINLWLTTLHETSSSRFIPRELLEGPDAVITSSVLPKADVCCTEAVCWVADRTRIASQPASHTSVPILRSLQYR
jgi:hypothetical protein